MMKTRIAALILGLWLATGAAWGQLRGPHPAEVSGALNSTALQAGKETLLAVVTTVPAPLHAQSRRPSDENYIPFEVTLTPPAGVVAGGAVYPPGEDKSYPALGRLNVYTGRVVVYVPLRTGSETAAGPATIQGSVRYQACDDQTCYMPQTVKFTVATRVAAAGEAVEAQNGELFAGYRPVIDQPAAAGATARRAGLSGADWGVWTAFGAALLAGLLFNVMPCVLPVLPLKAMGFYQASQHRRMQSILFGLVFSVGVISVFGLLAVLVLVLRVVTWGGIFQQAWFVWGMAILLAAFALSLFGLFSVNLPTGVYGITPRHDTYTGNFTWGALTAVLATPCTAPLLPPLMLWAASQSSAVGVPAMLLVGVGMSLPYLLLSAFPEAARKMPRTGAWAELFKQMMGFLLLASAVYFAAGRLVEGVNFWWAVLAVVAVGCVFLVVRSIQLAGSFRPVVVSAIIAVLVLGGTFWWTGRITGFFQRASGGAAVATHWEAYGPAAFEQRRTAGRIVLVKFTANWCATCQVIEGTVFQDAAVWDQIRRQQVTTFKADFSHGNPEGEKLLRQINPAGGIPLTAIYVPGQEQPIVLASIYSSGELMAALKQAEATASVAAKAE